MKLLGTALLTVVVALSVSVAALSVAGADDQPAKRVMFGIQLQESDQGVLAGSVVPKFPAAEAGIEAGDIIVRFAGEKVAKPQALAALIAQGKDGDEVNVVVHRDDKEITLRATLKAMEVPKRPVSGIEGKKAPAWDVEEWNALPAGKESLNVDDFKGKVVYLYCFQSWCPGCHSHGFPTLKKVREHFADTEADDVEFVVVQTVFEGAAVNTFEKGQEVLKKFELQDVPMGHSPATKPTSLMRAYKTRGTPWTIVIDKEGIVRSNGFRIDRDDAIKLIDELRKK